MSVFGRGNGKCGDRGFGILFAQFGGDDGGGCGKNGGDWELDLGGARERKRFEGGKGIVGETCEGAVRRCFSFGMESRVRVRMSNRERLASALKALAMQRFDAGMPLYLSAAVMGGRATYLAFDRSLC